MPDWPAMRLVDAGWTTLGELDRMSFDDVARANEFLDSIAEARSRAP